MYSQVPTLVNLSVPTQKFTKVEYSLKWDSLKWGETNTFEPKKWKKFTKVGQPSRWMKKKGIPGRGPPSGPPLSLFFSWKNDSGCWDSYSELYGPRRHLSRQLKFPFWDKITGKFKAGLQKNGHFPAKIFTKVNFTKVGVWCISERNRPRSRSKIH